MEKQIEVTKDNAVQPETVERTRDRRVFVPQADIIANADHYFVVADIPGADEKSVEISLEKNVLTITATVEPNRPEGYSLGYAEYGIGDYQRSFVLSDEIDRSKIEAIVRNGVLYLHLPKAEEAQARKITVKAG